MDKRKKNRAIRATGLLLGSALALGALISPAQAQSSWWNKYAAPAAQLMDEAATPSSPSGLVRLIGPDGRPAPSHVADAGNDWTRGGRDAAVFSPPLFGAVRVIGPDHQLIPANIIGGIGGSYLVETRKGTQIVSRCDIFDPVAPRDSNGPWRRR